MTAVPGKYLCENCGSRHEPPICPCPKCVRTGHPMSFCPMDAAPESLIEVPFRDPNTTKEWPICMFCDTRHQGECPCHYCHAMGHIIINCEEYKMNLLKKSRLDSEDRRRGRMQVTPNREVKRSDLALCGKCSSKHSIKEPCFTKDVDRAMRCLTCGGTTRDHLKGCKEVRGLRELCHTCRKPGHTSRNCPKCNYCGEYGHETENCTKKKDQCQKCGSDGHQTEFCRRHKRFTDMYAEIRKKDPIPSIDDSIYSPEFDTEEIKQQFEKLEGDRKRLRSLTPLRGEQERPEYKPRALAEKKINLKVPRDKWTPYRDESIYPITEEGEAQDGSETERKRANPLPRKTSHLERRRGTTGGSGGPPDDPHSGEPQDENSSDEENRRPYERPPRDNPGGTAGASGAPGGGGDGGGSDGSDSSGSDSEDVYLEGGDNTIRSDHLPLKKFLTRDTANNKVRNWAVELEGYRLKFEYIKGIKNTLADAMSRLVEILPDAELLPEPEGFEFGELVVSEIDVQVVIEVDIGKLTEGWPEPEDPEEPIKEVKIRWYMTDQEIADLQRNDDFCKKLLSERQNGKRKSRDCYFMSRGLLHKYVTDYKQRFEALVVPVKLSQLILKLAHDELGHNGTARTYALVKRMFYWKGLKKDVEIYIKKCMTCQEYTINAVRYTPGTFEIPEAPMDFISMDLIGEFRMGSTNGNIFALTVICMLSGYTWCVPIPDKSAEVVVRAYIKEVYNHFGGSRKIL